MTAPRVAVVMSGFPRRSETFAIAELLALHARGMLAAIVTTKEGDDGDAQPGVEPLLPLVTPLSSDASGDFPPSALDAVAARLSAAGVRGIHAYFAHTPSEVAAQLAGRLGRPYGFSAHARDARKASPPRLRELARGAACVIACNPDVVAELPDPDAVTLVPHGVDLERFPASPAPPIEGTVRLLAVGRLVEKKGFDVLIDAVAALGPRFRLRIVGEGPCRARLEARIARLGLGSRVTLGGALTHRELPAVFRDAHIVVVPSIVDCVGDRDGLPNVLLEAMASARPIVASNVAAVATAIRDGVDGLLTPPGEAGALSQALIALVTSPLLRDRLTVSARRVAERDFDARRCSARFTEVVGAAYA